MRVADPREDLWQASDDIETGNRTAQAEDVTVTERCAATESGTAGSPSVPYATSYPARRYSNSIFFPDEEGSASASGVTTPTATTTPSGHLPSACSGRCHHHAPSHSLSSFTSASTTISITNSSSTTIDFDSDSDTPLNSASPRTPAFDHHYQVHPLTQSNPSPALSSSAHPPLYHISSRRLSSPSHFQPHPFSPSFSHFSSPEHYPQIGWDPSPLVTSRPSLQSFVYKRGPTKSNTPSSYLSSRPVILLSTPDKSHRRAGSFRGQQYAVAQNRQRAHDVFWNVSCLTLMFLIVISNLIYFVIPLQAHLPHFITDRILRHKGPISFEAPERDCLVIYRIIGNDLPPRHSPHQTLTNLKFLLQHEDDFKSLPSLIPPQLSLAPYNQSSSDHQTESRGTGLKVRKYYILNRIADETQLVQVSKLLLSSGVPEDRILTIPFEMAEYQKRPVRSTQLLPPDLPTPDPHIPDQDRGLEQVDQNGREADEKRRWAMSRLRALDSIYHEKNLYAMNNNGGRNFGLSHGRAQADARWMLVLDGNCFMTPSALRDMVKGLTEEEMSSAQAGLRPASHVIIPMSRLLDNQDVLANNTISETETKTKPMSVEEPQIGFRFSSKERYSNQMRYGRRSKVELLWRLGAIQRNRRRLEKSIPDWESEEQELITEETYASIQREDSNVISEVDFVTSGWVHRLFSGDDRRQEEPTELAISRRSINRIKGIVRFLETLDQTRLLNLSSPSPPLFNLNLQALQHLRNSHQYIKLRSQILTSANSILMMNSKGHHPTIDGFLMALAYDLTHQVHYRSKALEIIRSKLLNPSTSQSSNSSNRVLSHPFSSIDAIAYHFPARPKISATQSTDDLRSGFPFSFTTSSDFSFYLDSLRLLSFSHPTLHSLTLSEHSQVRRSLRIEALHLTHLPSSTSHPSLHPIRIDLNLAALASYASDYGLLNRIISRAHLRMSCEDRWAHAPLLQTELLTGLLNIGIPPSLLPCPPPPHTQSHSNLHTSVLSPSLSLSRILKLDP